MNETNGWNNWENQLNERTEANRRAKEESHAAVMRAVRRKRAAASRRLVCTVAVDAALIGVILTAVVTLLACAVR